MNEESRRIISEYKTQIIVLLFALVAGLISISIVLDLIKIERNELSPNRNNINKKSQIAAIIILLSTMYFTYNALNTYKKEKTKANYLFLIAALLTLVAAGIRFINIFKRDVIEGAEDVIL